MKKCYLNTTATNWFCCQGNNILLKTYSWVYCITVLKIWLYLFFTYDIILWMSRYIYITYIHTSCSCTFISTRGLNISNIVNLWWFILEYELTLNVRLNLWKVDLSFSWFKNTTSKWTLPIMIPAYLFIFIKIGYEGLHLSYRWHEYLFSLYQLMIYIYRFDNELIGTNMSENHVDIIVPIILLSYNESFI